MQKPLLEILAENVKYYRAKTGMSQLKFAVQLDISPSYLNDIECGRQYASLKMLERFAHEFNIETYQLLIPKGVSQDEVLRSEYEEQLRNLKEQVVDLFDKQLKKKDSRDRLNRSPRLYLKIFPSLYLRKSNDSLKAFSSTGTILSFPQYGHFAFKS